MQRLDVSCAVRHIYVVRRQRVNIRFNIAFPSMPRSSKSLLCLWVPDQNPVINLSSPVYILHALSISLMPLLHEVQKTYGAAQIL